MPSEGQPGVGRGSTGEGREAEAEAEAEGNRGKETRDKNDMPTYPSRAPETGNAV